MTGPARIGVDLGGTKTEVALLDAGGALRVRRRVPTPPGHAAKIRAIRDLVAAAEAEAGLPPPGGVGIGVPGSIGPASGLMRNANSTDLNGHPLDRDLAEALGRPVRVENDANCFAVAEARAGAGRGAACVFGVILGTGVGGGIALSGRARTGRNGVAGEWGHRPLPAPEPGEHPGPECWCGRRGCLETWLSGPGLASDHARATGRPLPPEAIAEAAGAGDPAAASTLARHLDRLARGLAMVVDILDPDAIVLGGGLSNLPGLSATLPRRIGAHVFSDSFGTPVLANRLGDSAGVIGAAWLWSGTGRGPMLPAEEDRA